MKLTTIDYVILILYFSFVIGIGWRLRKSVTSAGDFLTAGHKVPVWITSLAFLAANLGAQEVVGMCASGAKYGIMTAHFYWIGAVPAMLSHLASPSCRSITAAGPDPFPSTSNFDSMRKRGD